MKNILRKIKEAGISLFLIIPPKEREVLLIIFIFIVTFPNVIRNIRKMKEVLRSFKEINPILYQNSKKALWNYSIRQSNLQGCKVFMETYKKQSLECIQKSIPADLPYNEPILVCAVKNDLMKVKMQIEHHKSLGVKNFVYIDNMSDDGTFEWLLSQKADIYRTADQFHSIVKSTWIRQISDIYGYNRWYLILDSDELFVYPGMETSKIHSLICFAEKENMNFIQSFLIDMYSKEKIFGKPGKTSKFDSNHYNIKKENCYFDTDSYFLKPSYKGKRIVGGPRLRVFGDKSGNFIPLLTKNPLIYLREENVLGPHYSRPYYRNFNHPIISGVLHYKFMPDEWKKYLQIVKQENYAGGSAEYKRYVNILKRNPDLCFYYSKSIKFNHSLDLLQINIFDKDSSQRFLSELSKEHKL